MDALRKQRVSETLSLAIAEHPRLRRFAATMTAACLGNLYLPLKRLRYLPALAKAGAGNALSLMSSRAFYSFLLAAGIFVSLTRQQRIRGRAGRAGGHFPGAPSADASDSAGGGSSTPSSISGT